MQCPQFGPPSLPLAACNNKLQAGLGRVQGSRGEMRARSARCGWLVAARQGGGTGKDPPHRGSYWPRWHLTRRRVQASH